MSGTLEESIAEWSGKPQMREDRTPYRPLWWEKQKLGWHFWGMGGVVVPWSWFRTEHTEVPSSQHQGDFSSYHRRARGG